jgi:hypothetical protein
MTAEKEGPVVAAVPARPGTDDDRPADARIDPSETPGL